MASQTPEIGLESAKRSGAAALLNALLADEYVLYTKTRNFHWNVTGPLFNDLHKFFESQYSAIDESIDEIAERVRMLGHTPVASLAGFLELTRLKEVAVRLTAQEMVGALLADHEAVIRQLREDVEATGTQFGDAGTQDFLTGLMEQHEKMAWMLRSMLE
jgi:starvation-inducible DNA-binding protein